MIVLDASATVDWLEGRRPAADAVADHLLAASSVHVPHLWLVEVAQVLRRHVLSGQVTASTGAAALEAAVDLPVERHAHEPLAPRVWRLRDNLTAYDATYVALAEALAAPLVTTDSRLARSPGHSASVALLGHPEP